jgi:hypothetical protein
MAKRSLAALLLLVAAAAAAAVGVPHPDQDAPARLSAIEAAPPRQLIGIVGKGQAQALARIDPDTMRPKRGRRVSVGSGGCAPSSGGQACWTLPPWSFAPHRPLLALALHEQGVARSLRVVDVRRMRVTADLPLAGGAIGSLAWLAPERLLAVQEVCCKERQRLVAFDLARRRVGGRRPLGGSVQGVGQTSRELVLLVAPANAVGPARLAIADRRGAVRSVRLNRIVAGVRLLPGADFRVERNVPGLAVDPDRRRAYVVSPTLVAEVDLQNLTVGYHEPRPSTSRLSRLLDWLDPPAYAKGASGPTRAARWLGGGLLAVTGSDEDFVEDARGEQQSRLRAAGLSLIDTGDWSVRTIDRGADAVHVADDLLLATGSSLDPATSEGDSIGLTAYNLDGRQRFQLFDGREAWVRQIYRGRVYLDVPLQRPPWSSLRVVGLHAGRVIRHKPARPLPWLLLDTAAGRWDG